MASFIGCLRSALSSVIHWTKLVKVAYGGTCWFQQANTEEIEVEIG